MVETVAIRELYSRVKSGGDIADVSRHAEMRTYERTAMLAGQIERMVNTVRFFDKAAIIVGKPNNRTWIVAICARANNRNVVLTVIRQDSKRCNECKFRMPVFDVVH